MSFTPDTAFVKQYDSMLQMAAAQSESRLSKAVQKQSLKGEEGYIEQLGSLSMVERTSRFAEVTPADITHSRRKYFARTYEVPSWIEKDDEFQMLINRPEAYAIRHAEAANQKIDDVIIEAFDASVMTGKTGTTTTTFDTANQLIASDFEVAATHTNLTVRKLLRALTKLNAAETLNNGAKRYIVCSSVNIESLLRDNNVTSADFNSVKALVAGEVNSFLGFEFIRSERLGLNGSYRKAFAFTSEAMVLVNSYALETKMDYLPERSHVLQILSKMRVGAVRNFENKIVRIDCNESA